ncbi:SEC-C metal-binding domain-containing protein [Bradyrhizobium sp. McL0616]|uniref:SEC-C metal-binding domain-containing protein n=1 Tax=Bradyrhizobium sp. McL0616 TaxID=3415674 RepID=UPI003CF6CC7B
MVEDIFAQLAAIRQSLEAELKSESDTIMHDANGIDQAPTIEHADVRTEDEPTKRNAPCPCGSGKRFKHCHGQHGSSLEREEPPLPHQITFDTAVEISSVQTSNVGSLPVDIGPAPRLSSLGESDQRNFEKTEFLHLQMRPTLGEDETGQSTERETLPIQGSAPRQALEATFSEGKESKAIAMIVAGHVKLKNRRALADLLAHRRKMLDELQAVSGINPASVVRTVLEEIALIEAALEELEPPPGTLPENEWA